MTPQTRRTLLLVLWVVLIGCVVVGSLSPAKSTLMEDIDKLDINDKVIHACAYLTLSLFPVVVMEDRRKGVNAGLSMFLLGVLLEGGQHFSPGRSVDYRDVLANGTGVLCGTLLGIRVRDWVAKLL
jgi:VanZ family protein